MERISVYCDESCHLPNDRQSVIVIGSVWCSQEKIRETAERIREIKLEHKLGADFEIKWSKVSYSKVKFYLEILDFFFDDDDLHFRAIVAPNKGTLIRAGSLGDHNEIYYKIYFLMLKGLFSPKSKYSIYIDIKDTCGASKVRRLHDALCKNMYDFDRKIIEKIQTVRSDEVQHVQLVDLLVGILSYASRGLTTSRAKTELVNRMKKRSGYSLKKPTLVREEKVNLRFWRPRIKPE